MLNDNKLRRMRDILTNPGVGVGVGAGLAQTAGGHYRLRI